MKNVKKASIIVISILTTLVLIFCVNRTFFRNGDSMTHIPNLGMYKEAEDMIQVRDKMEIVPESNLNFQLYRSYKVNTSGIRQCLYIPEKTQFTFFRQVSDLETWKSLREFQKTNFVFPAFDFTSADYQDKYLLITFGREILSMRYKYFAEPFEPNWLARADVTFAEEYHDEIMYLYFMDKIPLASPFLSGMTGAGYHANRFYIMIGSERVFWGSKLEEINELE